MRFKPSRKTTNKATVEHIENVELEAHGMSSSSGVQLSSQPSPVTQYADVEAELVNPFANKSDQELMDDGERFAKENGLDSFSGQFRIAALLARVAISDPMGFNDMDDKLLTEEDKRILSRELENKWDQPRELYYLVVLCSVAAAVQGMDETVTNGAQLYFPKQFGIDNNQWIIGLLNSAPYLCCAIFSCWITDPLNERFGRRGTIFITAALSFVTCLWQACTNSWQHLFLARFFLGLGIGPKSTTVPVYSAECSPAPIRGALVMMWQMWTAFGIMLGLIADLALFNVPDTPSITGLRWRLMLGSAGLPAIAVMAQVYYCPESPRWLIEKGRHMDAFKSLTRLRNSPFQAARDLFYIDALLKAEVGLEARTKGHNRFYELFSIPRNRRAAVASFIVMFMQQFCGINGLAYYSSKILTDAHIFNDIQALTASFGFGAVNFVFALPAIWAIDTFGRRNLLLTTFPFMSLFMLITAAAFWIPRGRTQAAIVTLSMYIFSMFYSPGEGPVPFTYSAEVHSLYIRSIGMSFATAITWFFNFLNALIFPRLIDAFKPQGVFMWFAAWNAVGFWLIFFFVPETKALTLEELDQVFNHKTRFHARYQWRQGILLVRKYIFRQKIVLLPPLYKYAQVKQDNTDTSRAQDERSSLVLDIRPQSDLSQGIYSVIQPP